MLSHGAGRGNARVHRHRRVLRHAGRDLLRRLPHAGLLCRHPPGAGAQEEPSPRAPCRALPLRRARCVLLLAGVALGHRSSAAVPSGPNYQPPKTEVSAAFANGEPDQPGPGAHRRHLVARLQRRDPEQPRRAAPSPPTTTCASPPPACAKPARSAWGPSPTCSPSSNANAGWTKIPVQPGLQSRPADPRATRDCSLYDAGFDATWELDFFGRVRRSIQAEHRRSRRHRWRPARTCWSRSSRKLPATTSSCAAPKTSWPSPAVTPTTSARRSTSAVAKLKAGRATELDTARARAQLDATLAIIPPLEAAVKHAIHRLSVLTGQQPTALDSELAPPAPMPALPPLVNIGNPADLLRRRPDIRAAERSLAAATARIGVATADLFPRVTFNGNVGRRRRANSPASSRAAPTPTPLARASPGPRWTSAASAPASKPPTPAPTPNWPATRRPS